MLGILEKLNSVSLKFLEPLTLKQTYSIISNQAINLLKVDYASIYLERNGKLKKVYATLPQLYTIVARKKNSLTYKAFKTRKVLYAGVEDFEKNYPSVKKLGVKSSIFVPLSYQGKSVGVLVLQSLSSKKISPAERGSMNLFGSMASLTIRKAELYEEMAKAIQSRDRSKFMERTLENINKASIFLLQPFSLSEMYKVITDEAVKLVEADNGALYIGKHDEIKRVYDSLAIGWGLQPRRRGYTYKAYSKREAFIIYRKHFAKLYPSLDKIGIKSVIFIPLSYKDQSVGVLQLRSFTEKELTLQELQILKLYGTVASLALRKTQLYEETKQAVKVRDLFFAMASHELRTPLTTLNGYIQLLYRKYKNTKSSVSSWVQELHSESSRLTQLVHELLEVNRIRTGQFEYVWQETSLRQIINKTIHNFQIIFPDRKIVFNDLVKDSEDVIIGDSGKLRQVFSNLLENADKFSPSNDEITVKLSSNNSDVVVTVTDKGKGIAAKDLTYIFEEFYRRTDFEKEGIGIGLYIAKNIIDKHRGEIKVSSKRNKGTAVIVTLPKANL